MLLIRLQFLLQLQILPQNPCLICQSTHYCVIVHDSYYYSSWKMARKVKSWYILTCSNWKVHNTFNNINNGAAPRPGTLEKPLKDTEPSRLLLVTPLRQILECLLWMSTNIKHDIPLGALISFPTKFKENFGQHLQLMCALLSTSIIQLLDTGHITISPWWC